MTATRGTRRLLDGDSFRAACSRESELTPRQLEVLKLLASGKTNWEIAEHFGITLDGAKWHVSEILGKLGFSSREEASAYWHWRRRPRQRLNRAMLALTALSLRRLLQVGAAVAAGAALAIAALVVAAVSRDGDPSLNRLLPGSAGEDPSPAAEATPSAEGPTARTDLYTEIYDRGGPDGGTLLGVLANPYAGRTAPPIRAAAFIDNLVEPRLIRMCEAGLLPPRAIDPDCTASVHTSGYTVTTSLDLELTEQAMGMIDEFVRSGLEEGCECHNGAIVTIDPASGQVVVYAPNRDPAESSNRRIAGDIDQLIEVNQAGPVFAPIVYLAWFERLGKAPLSTLWDTSPL
ncbi:MAG: LuxR C-terminal-related transcriptional regulator, partial [Dehalococcoidia bacterium]